MEKINIFIGKGGVGKSTCSALSATKAYTKKNNVLLDSLDPAHNLHDIFNQKFSNKAKKIEDKYYVRESDISKLGKKYIKNTQNQLKNMYHYQQSLNIDKYFSILKYAPGTEEYAALLALERCIDEKKFDNIFVDTPPTALTLKTLALPNLSLHWINSLLEMRVEIVNKKNTIKNIRKENQEIVQDDPIYKRLILMKDRYTKLNNLLKNKNIVNFILVLNEDEMSYSESLLIKKQMDELNFTINKIIINKSTENYDYTSKKLKSIFPLSTFQLNPFIKENISSIDDLVNNCGNLITL